MARKGRQALQKGTGGVGSLSQKTMTGRQAIEEDQEGLGGPSGEPGEVGRLLQRDGRDWEALS